MKVGVYSYEYKTNNSRRVTRFGKSTAAKLINEILSQNKIEVELFLEGNLNHPADYDGVSCFNKFEFDRLLSNSGDFKEVLLKKVLKKEAIIYYHTER